MEEDNSLYTTGRLAKYIQTIWEHYHRLRKEKFEVPHSKHTLKSSGHGYNMNKGTAQRQSRKSTNSSGHLGGKRNMKYCDDGDLNSADRDEDRNENWGFRDRDHARGPTSPEDNTQVASPRVRQTVRYDKPNKSSSRGQNMRDRDRQALGSRDNSDVGLQLHIDTPTRNNQTESSILDLPLGQNRGRDFHSDQANWPLENDQDPGDAGSDIYFEDVSDDARNMHGRIPSKGSPHKTPLFTPEKTKFSPRSRMSRPRESDFAEPSENSFSDAHGLLSYPDKLSRSKGLNGNDKRGKTSSHSPAENSKYSSEYPRYKRNSSEGNKTSTRKHPDPNFTHEYDEGENIQNTPRKRSPRRRNKSPFSNREVQFQDPDYYYQDQQQGLENACSQGNYRDHKLEGANNNNQLGEISDDEPASHLSRKQTGRCQYSPKYDKRHEEYCQDSNTSSEEWDGEYCQDSNTSTEEWDFNLVKQIGQNNDYGNDTQNMDKEYKRSRKIDQGVFRPNPSPDPKVIGKGQRLPSHNQNGRDGGRKPNIKNTNQPKGHLDFNEIQDKGAHSKSPPGQTLEIFSDENPSVSPETEEESYESNTEEQYGEGIKKPSKFTNNPPKEILQESALRHGNVKRGVQGVKPLREKKKVKGDGEAIQILPDQRQGKSSTKMSGRDTRTNVNKGKKFDLHSDRKLEKNQTPVPNTEDHEQNRPHKVHKNVDLDFRNSKKRNPMESYGIDLCTEESSEYSSQQSLETIGVSPETDILQERHSGLDSPIRNHEHQPKDSVNRKKETNSYNNYEASDDEEGIPQHMELNDGMQVDSPAEIPQGKLSDKAPSQLTKNKQNVGKGKTRIPVKEKKNSAPKESSPKQRLDQFLPENQFKKQSIEIVNDEESGVEEHIECVSSQAIEHAVNYSPTTKNMNPRDNLAEDLERNPQNMNKSEIREQNEERKSLKRTPLSDYPKQGKNQVEMTESNSSIGFWTSDWGNSYRNSSGAPGDGEKEHTVGTKCYCSPCERQFHLQRQVPAGPSKLPMQRQLIVRASPSEIREDRLVENLKGTLDEVLSRLNPSSSASANLKVAVKDMQLLAPLRRHERREMNLNFAFRIIDEQIHNTLSVLCAKSTEEGGGGVYRELKETMRQELCLLRGMLHETADLAFRCGSSSTVLQVLHHMKYTMEAGLKAQSSLVTSATTENRCQAMTVNASMSSPPVGYPHSLEDDVITEDSSPDLLARVGLAGLLPFIKQEPGVTQVHLQPPTNAEPPGIERIPPGIERIPPEIDRIPPGIDRIPPLDSRRITSNQLRKCQLCQVKKSKRKSKNAASYNAGKCTYKKKSSGGRFCNTCKKFPDGNYMKYVLKELGDNWYDNLLRLLGATVSLMLLLLATRNNACSDFELQIEDVMKVFDLRHTGMPSH